MPTQNAVILRSDTSVSGCTSWYSLKPDKEYGSSAFAKQTPERHDAMNKRAPLIDKDGEVRELTAEDLSHFKPAPEVLPPSLSKKLGVRGQQKAPTKERITIRLSNEVLQGFRATGKGWQS